VTISDVAIISRVMPKSAMVMINWVLIFTVPRFSG
jgi:hypothetical protein